MFANFFGSRGYVPAEGPRLSLGPPAPRSLGLPMTFGDEAMSVLSGCQHCFSKIVVRGLVLHLVHVDDALNVTVLLMADSPVSDLSVQTLRRALGDQVSALKSHLNADDCSIKGYLVTRSSSLSDAPCVDVKSLAEAHAIVGGSRLSVVKDTLKATLLPKPANISARAEQIRGMLASCPQLDAIQLRLDGTVVFGILQGWLEPESTTTVSVQPPAKAVPANSPVRVLERIAVRSSVARLRMENATTGILGAPLSLASGALGWTAMTRVHADNRANQPASALASVDVPPLTRIVFLMENQSLLTLTLNDVAELRLAAQPRQLTSSLLSGPGAIGKPSDLFDTVGYFVGNAVASSLRSGVANGLGGGGGLASIVFGSGR